MSLGSIIGALASFIPGSKLVDGGDCRTLAQHTIGINPDISALAGGSPNGTQVNYGLTRVITVASVGDSIKLPPAIPGAICTIYNAGAQSLQVFGQQPSQGGLVLGDRVIANDSIAPAAVTVGVSHDSGSIAIYRCLAAGLWKQMSKPATEGISVTDGSTTVTPATSLDFTSGATVTDGGGGVAQVAVAGGSSGLALIDGGTITVPVAWIGFPGAGISLPVRYQQFILFYQGIVFSASNYLAAAFSLDGGTTFVCDTLNADSYSINAEFVGGISPSSGVDSLMADINEASAGAYSGSWLIDPGSSSIFASVSGDINVNEAVGNKFIFQRSMINPGATTPVTPARATTLRILPDGIGDCDPPTSGINVIAGSWSLYGVPTP